MNSPSPSAPTRRYTGWLIVLLLLPLALAGAIAAVAYTQGLRVQSMGWRGGPVLLQWKWLQNDCVKAQGDRLHLAGLQPLKLTITHLSLASCGGPTTVPTAPPWTPPFDLSVDALTLPGLPPMALAVHQRDQRWHAQLHYRNGTANAQYDRNSARWTMQGKFLAADFAPEMVGTLFLTGTGSWQGSQLAGDLQARGEQLGYGSQPYRAGTLVTAHFADKQWQLAADLGAPLALGAGWRLEARQALQASGDLNGLKALQVNLRALGPQGSAQLMLNTDGGGVARGHGQLVLAGPSLAGTVPLRWHQRGLELQAASIQLPEQLRLSWPKPLQVPLSLNGQSRISAELRYRDIKLTTADSLLAWQQAHWNWQGQLHLAGNMAGYAMTGTWRGRLDASGPAGEPASLTLHGPNLQLALQVPVAGLRTPHWATRAAFNGRYGQMPLKGWLSASRMQNHWEGAVTGSSQLPGFTRGGDLQLTAQWYEQAGSWYVRPASRATVGEGLIGTTLIKPVSVTASTPLQISPQGVFGTLDLNTEKVVASRWSLPAISGQVNVKGWQSQAKLHAPSWQTELEVNAKRFTRGRTNGWQGTVSLSTPLSATMSRGLGVTLQKGKLDGQGRWQWQDHAEFQGNLTVSNLALNWGGILASGGHGNVQIDSGPQGVAIASRGPIELAELDVGTLARNVRLTLQSDLTNWHFADVYAEVLGGHLQAPALQWPYPQFQTVTVEGIDLAKVAALQNDPNPTVQLAGRVGGTVPVLLAKDSLAVQNGLLHNEGNLSLVITPSAGVTAMGQSNRAVQLALDTLSTLSIHDFLARLNMQADGWLDAAVTIKGVNPKQNRQPIVLNYTHRENVLELLRSLRIGDEISRRLLDRRAGESSQ